jgi:FMN-dependent NADH-azoreductase
MGKALKILRIDSSGRQHGSSSRALADELVAALADRYGQVQLVKRDLAESIPHVDQAWIEANFTPEENRSDSQRKVLSFSDLLVAELKEAEVLVFGVPIYNFGVPAAMKAWVDMIARARLTFAYTENGPVGLLREQKAFIVVASGGVGVDSPVDFATPYMRQALKFVGITDIEVIVADQQNIRGEESVSAARAQIANAVYTSQPVRSSHLAA